MGINSPGLKRRQTLLVGRHYGDRNVAMALGDRKEKVLLLLKRPEWNVMFWFLKTCFPDGRVVMDLDCWAEAERGSRTILFRGIKGLLGKNLVVRLKRGYYLINPSYFFAGHPVYLDRALRRFDKAVEGLPDDEDFEDDLLEGDPPVPQDERDGRVLPGPGRFAVFEEG